MKSIGIMQPTYLPWLGYFAMMAEVDTFVFLDSVQFERRSWQQRNRIKGPAGAQTLTIPVRSKGLREQLIQEVKIEETADFRRKHVKAIQCAYSKARYYHQYKDAIFHSIETCGDSLCELNIQLIMHLKELLGIHVPCFRSSETPAIGTKADLLVSICEHFGAKRYLSPVGSKVYIDQTTVFEDHHIRVEYNDFQHPVYEQLYGEFLPFLSIVDLLFNEGPASLQIIQKGREERRAV